MRDILSSAYSPLFQIVVSLNIENSGLSHLISGTYNDMTSSIAKQPLITNKHEGINHSAADAVFRLCELLEHTVFEPHVVSRLECPLPRISLLTWLQSNKGHTKHFWTNREKDFSIAGIGSACTLSASSRDDIPAIFNHMSAYVAGSNATFVGGIAFDEQSVTEQWQQHPYAEFVLPQVEVSFKNGDYFLAVNGLPESKEANSLLRRTLINSLKALSFSNSHSDSGLSQTRVISQVHSPNNSVWNERVSNILEDIASKEVKKVVLSRQTTLQLSQPIPGEALLNEWRQLEHCGYLFLLKSGPHSFIGNSPECLYKKEGNILYTEALAGTVPRGCNHQEDITYQKILRNDPKILNEHQLVAEYILTQISHLSEVEDLNPPVSIVKLANIQHLCASFNAVLNEQITDAEIVQHLHPTPAVCGTPRNKATTRIHQLTDHARGWYSGIVGVVSEHHSEFCVAIRSALINQDTLHCYAGVGLVNGSEAQAEWQELDAKIKTVLQLFNR